MRLAFLVACLSLSHSGHRDPFGVGVPQVRQGLGMGMVHRRSSCLCIRSLGIAIGGQLGRRGGGIGGRYGVGGSLKEIVFVACCFRNRLDTCRLLIPGADYVAVVGV